jgi:HNH endonuclease/NUMOD4 motif
VAIDHSTQTETWKPIPEYSGYEASTFGRIGSLWKQIQLGWAKGCRYELSSERRILKPQPTDKGYLEVNIRHDAKGLRTRRVHQLVLEAFVGPCPPGMVCCHGPDTDPSNCRPDNLRWDTQRENIRDGARHGNRKVMLEDQIAEMVSLDESGMPRNQIAVRLGVRPSCVTRVLARAGQPRRRTQFRRDTILKARTKTV